MHVSIYSSQTPRMPNPLIAKEQIPLELFKAGDVLHRNEQKEERKVQLQKAFELNRSSYSKARIVFETIIETLEVIDHVWELTDTNVLLKGGITIPISCIREVTVVGTRIPTGSVASNSI